MVYVTMIGSKIHVKFIDPMMGTETDFKIFDIVAFVYVALNLLIP